MSESPFTEEKVRDARIGRIVSEFLDRRARGEAEPEAELLARHPDLADDLCLHLDILRDVQPSSSKIGSLITQGILQKSSDPRYPAELGAYKIVNLIDRGGMGIVLKAYEESLNRTIALKILRPELTDDGTAVARFEREAKAAAGLRHPNIVAVYAVGEEHGVHFLAMEHIAGPTLAEAIREGFGTSGRETARGPRVPARRDPPVSSADRHHTAEGCPILDEDRQSGVEAGPGDRRPLPAEAIRSIFRQLLSGLACAHEAGLIHRDVKSSNILLDGWPSNVAAGAIDTSRQAQVPAGRLSTRNSELGTLNSEPGTWNSEPETLNSLVVKIADFGLARMISAQTRVTLPDSVLGTPEYMSPEQARGEPAEGTIDHRTDLYSAGVVLYEMLTGRTPFKADTPSAVIHQILHDEPADPRTISEGADPHLASLALRMMAKRPEDRFDSASEAIAALDTGERVCSLEKRRQLSHRSLWGVLAVGMLSIICWGIWKAALRQPPITDVRVNPDVPHRIQAQYGEDTLWETFYSFHDTITLRGAEVVRVDGRGRQIIVAGLTRRRGVLSFPLDDSGAVLVALERNKQEAWRIPLHSELHWPDCQEPRAWWDVKRLCVEDLDGVPGKELVVVVSDPDEYPTRISIVDPCNGELRSSFWHIGQMIDIRVIPRYFDDGRPAILAWGWNNKLDGFEDGLRAGEAQWAHWGKVHVVMIIDPMNMNGLGPPAINLERFCELTPDHPIVVPQPVLPCAYAFLDTRANEREPYVPEARPRRQPSPQDSLAKRLTYIESVECERPLGKDGTATWFRVNLGPASEDGQPVDYPYLLVDSNLRLQKVGPVPSFAVSTRTTKEYWARYWHTMIQNGEYVTHRTGSDG